MTTTTAAPPGSSPTLPAVIALRPHSQVFELGDTARFVGLDPETAVVVEDLPPPLAAMLDELGASAPCEHVVERAVGRGARREDALALLDHLHRCGAIVDGAGERLRARRRADAVVVVRGDGPLAVGLATGLAAGGVGAVHVRAAGTVSAADLGTGLTDADRGRPRAEAVAAAVRALAPDVVTGRPPARSVPDLVVLTDALLPDPALLSALQSARTAHLPVRLRDGTGLVGPLVLPGRTACLRCLELHRRAREPVWPAVAAQLVGRRGRGDPASTLATAALGAAQALAALDGLAGDGAPPLLDATLEIEPTAGTLRRRSWPAHPDCGCGAAQHHGAQS
jgi:bacteriocin biosynthesis cyclodehydratase domain-containing protein